MSLFADSESSQVAIVTVFSMLMILDIVGNSLVCFIIARNQDMRTPTNYLLVNLVVADLMVAIFFSPMYIFVHAFTHPDGVTGDMLCKLLTGGNFGWIGGTSSAFTLIAIATERYYAVHYPHGNKGRLTFRKLKIIIPCCWIFSLVINSPHFFAQTFDNSLHTCVEAFPELWMGKAFSMTWLLVFSVIPILIMVALYSKVVYKLWFKRENDSVRSVHQKGVIKVRKRVTLMVVLISIIFAVCWLADGITYILSYYTTNNKPKDITYAIAFTLILFNSAVNPFVYALINERFQEKIRAMVCCKCGPENMVHSTSETEGNGHITFSINPAHNNETSVS